MVSSSKRITANLHLPQEGSLYGVYARACRSGTEPWRRRGVGICVPTAWAGRQAYPVAVPQDRSLNEWTWDDAVREEGGRKVSRDLSGRARRASGVSRGRVAFGAMQGRGWRCTGSAGRLV